MTKTIPFFSTVPPHFCAALDRTTAYSTGLVSCDIVISLIQCHYMCQDIYQSSVTHQKNVPTSEALELLHLRIFGSCIKESVTGVTMISTK